MADEKENGMNNDQTEKKMSDYEELLNGFSGDDQSDEGQDGIALSELLDGIDSQDETEQESGDSAGKIEEIDLDAINDLNIEDFTEDSPEDNELSAETTPSGTFDIDVDSEGEEDLGGYSSVLNELNGDSAGEPEELDDGAGEDESATMGIPVLDDMELFEVDSDSPDDPDEESSRDEPVEEAAEEALSFGDLLGDEMPEVAEKEPEPATQEIPVFTDEETIEEIAADFVDEDEDIGENETEEAEEVPLLDDVDYALDIDVVEEEQDVSAEPPQEDEAVVVDSDISYGDILNEDMTEDFGVSEEVAEEQEWNGAEESGIEEIDLEESTADTGENLSYASMLDETPGHSGDIDEYPEIEDREPIESIDDGEFSLDELDSDEDDTGERSIGGEFNADSESDEPSFDDFLSPSGPEEEEFVISGAEDSDEEDFLKLHDEEPAPGGGEEDLIPGIAEESSKLNVEVKLAGFEMDVEEQMRAVTRGELLLAQGKASEATDIYSQIVTNKGVSPWVAKRCAELGIDYSASTAESESEPAAE